MLRNITLLAFFLAFFGFGETMAQKTIQTKQGKPAKSTIAHKVGIIAHRGFYKYDGAAENSIASMQNAVDHDFFGTEFDVRITGDNIAILYHNDNIQGLPIEELPLAELQLHPGFTLSNGELIPTVKEFFNVYFKARSIQQSARNTTTRLIYEIKPQRNPDKLATAIVTAYDMAKQYDLSKEIIFISFSIDACKMMHDRIPEASIGYLGGDIEPAELHDMGISVLDYNFKVLLEHSEWVTKAHELGMTVIAWTVNDKQTVLDLTKLGVDYITTDLPLDLNEWISNNR